MKKHKSLERPSTPADQANGAITSMDQVEAQLSNQHEIERRAYHIWEERGRPQGRDQEHWFEAELQVAAELASPRALGAAAGSRRTNSVKGQG